MLKQLIKLISLYSFCASCVADEIMATMPVKSVGSLYIITSVFKPEDHRIKYCGDYLCLIDGNLFFGSDGKIPKTITKRLFIKFNGIKIDLNITGMFNAGITAENISQHINVNHYWGGFYKIAGHFSDGAGSYIAQWIVSKDGSIRTHLSDMETAGDIAGMLSEVKGSEPFKGE